MTCTSVCAFPTFISMPIDPSCGCCHSETLATQQPPSSSHWVFQQDIVVWCNLCFRPPAMLLHAKLVCDTVKWSLLIFKQPLVKLLRHQALWKRWMPRGFKRSNFWWSCAQQKVAKVNVLDKREERNSLGAGGGPHGNPVKLNGCLEWPRTKQADDDRFCTWSTETGLFKCKWLSRRCCPSDTPWHTQSVVACPAKVEASLGASFGWKGQMDPPTAALQAWWSWGATCLSWGLWQCRPISWFYVNFGAVPASPHTWSGHYTEGLPKAARRRHTIFTQSRWIGVSSVCSTPDSWKKTATWPTAITRIPLDKRSITEQEMFEMSHSDAHKCHQASLLFHLRLSVCTLLPKPEHFRDTWLVLQDGGCCKLEPVHIPNCRMEVPDWPSPFPPPGRRVSNLPHPFAAWTFAA